LKSIPADCNKWKIEFYGSKTKEMIKKKQKNPKRKDTRPMKGICKNFATTSKDQT
jgi:hypothetical protein